MASDRLVAEQVRHRYGRGPEVLSGVDLVLEADGGATAVTAPSGSGKTTLLAVLGGLTRPSGGSVRRHGRSGTSWILQGTNVLPRRSTLDNVALVPLATGADRRRSGATATGALEAVGLAHRLEAAARTLSGGEQQRLGIARALASDAPFVLADEPTGQLDRATSEAVADVLFASVRGRAVHLVLVTHDPALAERCDRWLELVGGRLLVR